MIHRSPLPDVEIPDDLLFDYVFAVAEERGGHAALIDGPSGRTFSYAELKAAVQVMAGGLVSRGFGVGDVLAIMSPNVPEYAIVFHGAAMAGGTVTTINPTYTEREVHHQLLDAGASILVTIPMFLETARAAAQRAGIDDVYVIGESDDAPSVTELFGEPLAEQVPVSGDHVVVLPYSSGTTGLSKGVELTHRNLVANIEQTLAIADVTPDEVIIAVLPFFHIYGMQVLMNMGLRVGVTIVTMPRFDLEEFLRLHQDHRITRSFVVPPIVVALAKHPMVDDFDLSALELVFSGAAPLSAELSDEVEARLGCDVVQGYGMTELSPVSHSTPRGQGKPGSVGITLPNTETLVVDTESGAPWVSTRTERSGYGVHR